jgi:hypothetical protein
MERVKIYLTIILDNIAFACIFILLDVNMNEITGMHCTLDKLPEMWISALMRILFLIRGELNGNV